MNFEQPRITPGYFATLRQPILVGREFTASDVKGQPNVAVVNLAFAKRFFGSPQNALGRAIAEGGGDDVKFDTTIVGVVGDIEAHRSAHTDARPPSTCPTCSRSIQPALWSMCAPRSRRRRSNLPFARPFISSIPRWWSTACAPWMSRSSRSASDERALAFLAIGFSVLAMVLAAVGLYGVLAYSTEQRTREIGVRLALGSQRSASSFSWFARWPSSRPSPRRRAAIRRGLAQLFRSQLYGVTTFDPITLGGAVFLTAVMVALAAALPARRAATVQPMQALRNE